MRFPIYKKRPEFNAPDEAQKILDLKKAFVGATIIGSSNLSRGRLTGIKIITKGKNLDKFKFTKPIYLMGIFFAASKKKNFLVGMENLRVAETISVAEFQKRIKEQEPMLDREITPIGIRKIGHKPLEIIGYFVTEQMLTPDKVKIPPIKLPRPKVII